jgi:hypothetical protein
VLCGAGVSREHVLVLLLPLWQQLLLQVLLVHQLVMLLHLLVLCCVVSTFLLLLLLLTMRQVAVLQDGCLQQCSQHCRGCTRHRQRWLIPADHTLQSQQLQYCC